MKKYKQDHPAWHHHLNTTFFAGIFIVSGALLLARNLGYVSQETFSLVISWPTLLIAVGLLQIIKSHITSGLILTAVGSYFLLPRIEALDIEWLSLYWPILLIIGGIWLLFKLTRRNTTKQQGSQHSHNSNFASYATTEGFVQSEVTFGSAEHIVLDAYFTGASIRNTFGGTVLDLRHTQLKQDKTYIDIECEFGGIELYIPSEWPVTVIADTTLAGYSDKRNIGKTHESDKDVKEIIIRGKLAFSGLEIKS